MSAARGLLRLGLAGLVGGCGGDDPALWGLLHGHVSAEDDGLYGFLVWELYEPEWKRKRGAELHRCARVLSIQGSPAELDSLESCPGCDAVYALEVDNLDDDCPGSEGSAPGLSTMTHLATAPLGAGDAGIGAHGKLGLRVLLSWDGLAAEPAGVLWDEGYELGEPPAAASAWTPGRRYTLWPGEVWRLKEAALQDRPVADAEALR